MNTSLITPRLELNSLTTADSELIAILVNTPEWVRFIGQRNITTKALADQYVSKIIDNTAIDYWVVRLTGDGTPIGIITFIKRDYLDHQYIGFAFLSDYCKKGYAFEATAAVLKEIKRDSKHTNILATTVNDNINSIKLLEKLGLEFLEEITVEKELLLLYSATADKLAID